MALRKVPRLLLLAVLVLLLAGVVAVGLLQPDPVPAAVIRAAMSREPALIGQAWVLPTASTFGKTVEYQANRSLCGPTSLANVFRSLGESASSTTEAVLEHTGYCWTGYCILGLTLDELAEVARQNTSRKVTVLRHMGEAEFRRHLARANDPRFRYIVNFTRSIIFGAGVGHHSPIAAYLADRDLVLVLDVNAEFQPWLVETDRLYAAMNTLDGERKRGLLLIE